MLSKNWTRPLRNWTMIRSAIYIVLLLFLSNSAFGQTKLDKTMKKLDKGVHKGIKEVKKIGKKSGKGAKNIYKEVKHDLSPIVKKVNKEAREVFEIGEKEVNTSSVVIARRKKQLQKSIDNGSVTAKERKELEKKIKAAEKQRDKLAKAIEEEGKALAE